MTKEQIENLREGDRFVCVYTVTSKRPNSCADISTLNSKGEYVGFFNDSDAVKCGELMDEEFGEFELFDVVTITPDKKSKTIYGPDVNFKEWRFWENRVGKIVKKVEPDGNITVDCNGLVVRVNVNCLTLLSKAPRERYAVEGSLGGWCVVDKTSNKNIVTFSFSHPLAREHAILQCKFLNKRNKDDRKEV